MIIDNSSNFDLSFYVKLTSLFIVSQLVMVITNTAFDWLGTLFHTKYRSQTLHEFFNTLSSYDYKFFQNNQVGNISSRISDAFNIIPMIVFTFMQVFVNFIFYLLVAFATLIRVDIFFIVIMLTWIVIFLFLTYTFYNKYEPLNRRYAKVRPKIYGYLADYLSNIITARYFSNTGYEKRKLTYLTNEFISISTKCGLFLRNYYAIHGLFVMIYMAGILIFMGFLAKNKLISPGDFALIFMINYKVIDSLFVIANNSRDFVVNCGVVENAISILEYKNLLPSDHKANHNNIVNGQISFKNVFFSYENDSTVLEDINIDIKSQETIGITGYSGSGKTTFINLILRIFEPQKGVITIDGIDIKKIKHSAIYKAITCVDQRPSLFHRSIYDNIKYGNLATTKNDIINAAKQASADDFISKLPAKYDTFVGEKGFKLSGGQSQRIALARAILKDAPIVILDEITSQIDSKTENIIQDNMHNIIRNKTAILITHRLATLKKVDRILVFDNGKIVESGSLKSLLLKKGLFRKLWDSQKDGYITLDNKNSS